MNAKNDNLTPPAPRHVFVWRVQRGIPFQHHGVCLGDGTVVHFTDGGRGIAGPAGDAEQFRICRTPLSVFSPDGPAWIHEVEHPQRLSDCQIRRRALRCVGRPGVIAGQYELMTHNCEHFANWCVTGQFESRQVSVCAQRAVSAGAKAVLTAVGRVGTRGLVAKSRAAVAISRGASPWLLSADIVQWTTEAVGHHVGLKDDGKRRQVARWLGGSTAAAVGLAGGPIGLVVAAGTWFAGESVAQLLIKSSKCAGG